MSQGIVTRVRRGANDPRHVYIMLRNGSIWAYHRKVDEQKLNELLERVHAHKGKRMSLAGWQCVVHADGTVLLPQRSVAA